MQQQDYQTATRDIKSSESWKTSGYRSLYESLFYNSDNSDGLQSIHTPFELCSEILDKLIEFSDIKNANIAVLFNLEFVDILIEKFKINPDNITFFTDSKRRSLAAKEWYKVNNIIEIQIEGRNIIMPKPKQEFDVIVMNPPYQPPVKSSSGGSGSRNTIWPEFVKKAISITRDNGYIAAVHPVKWRKPEDNMFKIMTSQNMKYLEMHTKKDGIKMFGAMTPYDWYIMQKSQYMGKTIIKETSGKQQIINLRDFSFLPNCNFELVDKLLAKPGEEKCEVLFSYSYESRKNWMNEIQTKNNCYPCVHWTGKREPFVKYLYSSKCPEMMKIHKIIFAETDTIANAIIDCNGEYGITPGCIGLKINSKENGYEIKRALESDAFNNLLKTSLRWSQFRIDQHVFRYFRRDFWKEFI